MGFTQLLSPSIPMDVMLSKRDTCQKKPKTYNCCCPNKQLWMHQIEVLVCHMIMKAAFPGVVRAHIERVLLLQEHNCHLKIIVKAGLHWKMQRSSVPYNMNVWSTVHFLGLATPASGSLGCACARAVAHLLGSPVCSSIARAWQEEQISMCL